MPPDPTGFHRAAQQLFAMMFHLGALVGSRDLLKLQQAAKGQTKVATASRTIPLAKKHRIVAEFDRLWAQGERKG